jgi:hypothetical protein
MKWIMPVAGIGTESIAQLVAMDFLNDDNSADVALTGYGFRADTSQMQSSRQLITGAAGQVLPRWQEGCTGPRHSTHLVNWSHFQDHGSVQKISLLQEAPDLQRQIATLVSRVEARVQARYKWSGGW